MSRALPEFLDRTSFKERMKSGLNVDPSHTAILTIDMQRKYLDEAVGESTLLPEEAHRVVTATKQLLDYGRAHRIPIIHAYVTRRKEEQGESFHAGGVAYLRTAYRLSESQLPHRPAIYRPDRPIGSPQSEVPPQLLDSSDIHVSTKKTLDSFQHTDLQFLLKEALDAHTVILTGINTDTCVYSTTFSAANLGFIPIVIADCVASMRGKDSHWMALELMSRSIAWVLSLEELLEVLEGNRVP